MEKTHWQWEIKPQTSWAGTSVKELWGYRDLLMRLVRREFLMMYQQTVLGPVWVLLQPLLTVLIYVLVFNKVIGISTEGIPAFLFYLSGITLWNLFADIYGGTSSTFQQNAHVFNKVYFPRFIVPLSVVVLHFLRFLIQLSFLIVVIIIYTLQGKVELHLTTWLLAIPAVIGTAMIALGAGLIFSVLTAKYRDLQNFVPLFTRLLMFLCPIFYSMSIVPPKIKWLVALNPLALFFEQFRYAFLGKGSFSASDIVYGILVTGVFLIAGTLIFNKYGDKLMDVI